MIRILLIFNLLLCSMCLHAQKEIERTKTLKDPFYLQLYLGINKSANENLPFSEFSSYPWSGGLFVGVGKEFDKLWGWRAALRFNHNKSRNVQNCETKETWGWNSLSLFGDVTFDVSDCFRKNTERSKHPFFNVKAFAGLGFAYTFNFDKVPLSYTRPYSRSSRVLPAVRAGLTATCQIATKWRIGAELSQNFYEDHFNGVASDIPVDGRTNLKIGLTYLFIKSVREKKPVLYKNRLKNCPSLPLMMPNLEEVKRRRIAGRAFLDFPVNEMIIYPSYRNNPNELARIKATVDSAMFDKSVTVTKIYLHGYASPESPYSNNTRLAKGRTESLMNYLVTKYGFAKQIFENSYTPEDWSNLRGFLTNMQTRRVKGDYWYDNKAYVETPEAPEIVRKHCEELLSVIDKEMEPDAKEELLKQVGGGEPYQWLLKHVYPGLRHTDYLIEYEVKHYPVEKSRKLIYTHPEALSLDEMYKVAASYEEGSDNWLDALLIAVRQYPENEIANYNAACGCTMTKRLVDAKKYLAKAGKNDETRYVANVIKAMEGDIKWELKKGKLIVIE